MRKVNFAKTFMGLVLAGAAVFATPSTQIWNPSTDIQAVNSFHLGVDNYFSIENNANKPYAFGTDIGLTYGLIKDLEIGFDIVDPTANPLYFNAKYGFAESESIPAVAAGIFNAGTQKDVTDYNIIYIAAAKTFDPVGRFSLGYYYGNDRLLITETGEKANTGFILSWDKAISEKVWLSIDYASGASFYGSVSFGGSYSFAPNTSIIFGFVIFNNRNLNSNNTFTTQLDINL
ncbi:MAG: hypothetical protein A2044_07140 [Candidatus Firestonebacteria bacterium GWA2_43_8]|nr:MAG: hypothetical protein A2044_07140 [Candidatus Firestonebacteria bacterium GWA2_43_8]